MQKETHLSPRHSDSRQLTSERSGTSYYLHLHPHMRIWLYPEGAVLQRIGLDGFPDPVDRRDLTPLALRCLRLCRGNRTFGEVLLQIHREVEGVGFDATRSAAEFLGEMLNEGILVATVKPQYRPCPEYGNTDRVIPMHLSIELTNCCNLTCAHCYRNSSPDLTNYFDTAKLLHLMDEAAAMGVCTVELTGGEPTLHPDFIHLARHAATRFGFVAVLTNGTMIRPQLLNPLRETSERLVFQVDLDGVNAEQHEDLRRLKGSYESSIHAIYLLVSQGFRLRVAMNVYKGNVHHVEQTCRHALSLGATWFGASPVIDVGRGHEDLVIQGNEVLELHETIDRLHEQYPKSVIGTEQFRRIKQESGRNCGAGWRSVTVGPDGIFRPCVMFPTGVFSFNCDQPEGLAGIVEKADLKYFLELEPPDKRLCRNCPLESFCRGCFARPWYAVRRAAEKGLSVTCHWASQTGFDRIVPDFLPTT